MIASDAANTVRCSVSVETSDGLGVGRDIVEAARQLQGGSEVAWPRDITQTGEYGAQLPPQRRQWHASMVRGRA